VPLTDEELAELVGEADHALQAIQDELGDRNDTRGRVRFPRGFIRRVDTLRARIPELGSEVRRRNVCYALMMTDVLRWLATRTDLSGTALSMVVKEGICVLGAICEWMTKEGTRGHASSRPYRQRTAKLVELEVIDEKLRDELDWVWDVRCREHLHQVNDLEHEVYNWSDYNRARRAYDGLRRALLA